jgi:hypothetical protein
MGGFVGAERVVQGVAAEARGDASCLAVRLQQAFVDRLDVFLGDFRDFHWIAPHHRSLDRTLDLYPFMARLSRFIIACSRGA